MSFPKSGYFNDANIIKIKDLFIGYLNESKLDIENSKISDLRNSLFDFFALDEFKKFYFDITIKACEHLGNSFGDLVVQQTPTPRVFRPGAIGTSFHCDYWYGHGLETYTMWVPLSDLEEGNTFYVCNPNTESSLYIICEDSLESIGNLDVKLKQQSDPVLPSEEGAYLFKSTLLHGSPRNTSERTRISFDFRFGNSKDVSSTKDIGGYYHFIDGKFIIKSHPFSEKRLLRYVCGGKHKNTFIQHIIIESAAKQYRFNLYEQEAEIERYGYPVLQEYLENREKSKGIQGIVVASKSIIEGLSSKLIRNSELKIWCVLENAFAHELY